MKVRNFASIAAAAGAAVTSVGIQRISANPVTPGDILVYQSGDGSAALGTSAAAVFVDEYTPTGTLVQTFAMPQSGANPLTCSGSATTEGIMTLSTNGQYAVLTGYGANVGTATVNTVSGINRVVGVLNLSTGAIDTTTSLTNAFTGSSIRGVASIDGNEFWVSGNSGTTNGGILYVPSVGSSSATQVSDGTLNLRGVSLFGGNLYDTTSAGSARGIQAVTGSTNPPTNSTGVTVTTIIPPTADASDSFQGMFMLTVKSGDSFLDTAYLIDNTAGTLQKYSTTNGTTWTADGSSAAVSSLLNLTGILNSNGTVTFYATTSSAGGVIDKLTDSSGFGGSITGDTWSTIVNLTTNPTNPDGLTTPLGTDEAFRGLAIVVPEPASLVGLCSMASVMLMKRSKRFQPVGAISCKF